LGKTGDVYGINSLGFASIQCDMTLFRKRFVNNSNYISASKFIIVLVHKRVIHLNY